MIHTNLLGSIVAISLGAILTNNFIFSQFLGCCPFLGCSDKTETAAGMGLAVVVGMGLASASCWLSVTRTAEAFLSCSA